MFSVPIHSIQPKEKGGFFDLPPSIRNRIYFLVLQNSPKSQLNDFSLPFVCRQMKEEFSTLYDYHVKFSLKCCLGRNLQNRDATKFYTWNYHFSSWTNDIEVDPEVTGTLRYCRVRCTMEELGDWERRSDIGSDCFKDCIRLLIRNFKSCPHMRNMKISFDHFVLSGKKGLLDASATWERLKSLTEISGLTGIKFETPGFNEDFVWMKEKGGRKGRGKEQWVMVEGDTPQVAEREPKHIVQCGAVWPKGYTLRRGCT